MDNPETLTTIKNGQSRDTDNNQEWTIQRNWQQSRMDNPELDCPFLIVVSVSGLSILDCCQCLWIDHSWLLSVSLDCPFLIVVSFSGLSEKKKRNKSLGNQIEYNCIKENICMYIYIYIGKITKHADTKRSIARYVLSQIHIEPVNTNIANSQLFIYLFIFNINITDFI
jgi:hypothetical protein